MPQGNTWVVGKFRSKRVVVGGKQLPAILLAAEMLQDGMRNSVPAPSQPVFNVGPMVAFGCTSQPILTGQ